MARRGQDEQADEPMAAAEMAMAEMAMADEPMDKTVPGGRYLVGADAHGRGGMLVDANGNPIED